MPIEVTCDGCRRTVTTADSMAGTRIICPNCASEISVPELESVVDAELVDAELLDGLPDDSLGDDSAAGESRRPCPACGEMIAMGAAKCRFCDEIFDPALRKKSKPKKRGAFGIMESDDDPNALEWLIAVFCGLIGILVSVLYLAQGKKKGWKMLAATAVMFGLAFAFGVISAMLERK